MENIRFQAYLFLVAVPLNLLWEVTQISAYDFPEGGLMKNLLGCFIPSLGDGLMILVIYWIGWAVFRNPQWILKPGPKGYSLMAGVGLTLALFVEWNALLRTGAWAYNKEMPILPLVGVGLLPIFQMLILPPATALLLRWTWTRREQTV